MGSGFSQETEAKAKGKRHDFNSFDGRVQQRIDSTLRAITPPQLRTSHTRSGRFNPLVVRRRHFFTIVSKSFASDCS
jgi:hypothetical protein